jgi:hypothetical protein
MTPLKTHSIKHLVTHATSWERDDTGFLVTSARQRGGDRERLARARDIDRAWGRAKVRKEAWEGRPHHAFRKGFVSELKRAGADSDAVEFLVGHSLGLRGIYIDPDALPLRSAVDTIPDLHSRPEFGAPDPRDQRPVREITLDNAEKRPRDPLCPTRVPSPRTAHDNVITLDAFRRKQARSARSEAQPSVEKGGGGGSRTRVRNHSDQSIYVRSSRLSPPARPGTGRHRVRRRRILIIVPRERAALFRQGLSRS